MTPATLVRLVSEIQPVPPLTLSIAAKAELRARTGELAEASSQADRQRKISAD
jgi:hypothetical protein